MKRIVVGMDFSEEAEVARLQARNIAAATGAEMTLVYVVLPPENWDPGGIAAVGVDYARIVSAEIDSAKEKLAGMSEPEGGDAALVEGVVEVGHPDSSLTETAEKLGADLVVVGTHGRTGFRRLLLGSVAERVVRRSHCSVLVARPRSSGVGGYDRILVPTDFSALAERALAEAARLVSPNGVIDVVNWTPISFPAYGYHTAYQAPDEYHQQVANASRERGAELLERLGHLHHKINFQHQVGPATQGIQSLLDGDTYSLVAMGSHGRRGVRRLILGSVAEATVRHAPCSVLVAR